jgi:hypothetical protein
VRGDSSALPTESQRTFSGFECFYLRPTNGRADDQVRRNHSVQYISFRGFPWYRLESPEKYESYTDLVPASGQRRALKCRPPRRRCLSTVPNNQR